jgi:tetratricopeptide (TPR) repeat protein
LSTTDDNKERLKLQKEVRSHFRKQGWRVADEPINFQLRVLRQKYDFAVMKGDLLILISCVDKALKRFYSNYDIVQKFDSDRRELRAAASVALVFINGAGFEEFNTAELAKSGIILFSALELTRITEVDICPDKPPSQIDSRIALIYEQNMKYCLSISESCFANDNLSDAIEWARLPTAGNQKTILAHMKLLNLLMHARRLDEAEALAQQLLLQQPRNILLLSKMRSFATNRGDKERAELWSARMVAARKSTADPPDLLKRLGIQGNNISTTKDANLMLSSTSLRVRFWTFLRNFLLSK